MVGCNAQHEGATESQSFGSGEAPDMILFPSVAVIRVRVRWGVTEVGEIRRKANGDAESDGRNEGITLILSPYLCS